MVTAALLNADGTFRSRNSVSDCIQSRRHSRNHNHYSRIPQPKRARRNQGLLSWMSHQFSPVTNPLASEWRALVQSAMGLRQKERQVGVKLAQNAVTIRVRHLDEDAVYTRI